MKVPAPLEMASVLWRTFGWRGVAQRAEFETRRRLGRFRATPRAEPTTLDATAIPNDWPFRPDARRIEAATDREQAMARAMRARDGQHHAYRWSWRPRPTNAAAWLTNPETGFTYAENVPWWLVPHYDTRAGDIKDVWEPARFGWAYDLARGWLISRDESFVSAFRDGVSTFLRSSPPFRGPQWACGQETAIRAIAWLWAEGACSDARAFDQRFREELLQALAWSAERIGDAFAYAQSQRNNHGLSEATGLIAIGARLRGADPRAVGWIAQGHRALEQMILDQIEGDGWYIQHSFNYARVALDQLTIARRMLHAAGRDLSPRAQQRIRALIDLVAVCMNPVTGELPNHGPNDGAYVLPLSMGPYRDFRPSLTAAAATFGASLLETIDPDQETLAWLRADTPTKQPSRQTPWVRSGASGWAVGVTAGARIFVRAGSYRSRPGHIDPGHVDVWIEGRPVAIDAGTFRYSAAPPWNNGLVSIDVHNTVAIAGIEAARRGPRFLWLAWPRASIDTAAATGESVSIRLTNDSWQHAGIRHYRVCTLYAHGASIVDEIHAHPDFTSPVHVHWLLEDGATVQLAAENATITEVLGDPSSVEGWTS